VTPPAAPLHEGPGLRPIQVSVPALAAYQHFIENAGQYAESDVRYYIHYPNLQIAFADGQVRFRSTTWQPASDPRADTDAWQADGAASWTLELGNGGVRPQALGELGGYGNYYVGSDPDRWYTHVRYYARLIYRDVYPHIDVTFFFNAAGQLTYEYHVRPGGDPSQIRLSYLGVEGIDLRGVRDLTVQSSAGRLLHTDLLAYQERAGHRESVLSSFQLTGAHSFGFALPRGFDPTRKLVIDPTLLFSTYWGSGPGVNRTVAIDSAGNIYMSGGTSAANWPTTVGPPFSGDTDVAVAKFNPDGQLMWSTLLGGPSEDYAYVSAVSDSGELYLSGRAGTGFPTTAGAFDRTFHGGIGGGPHGPIDAFVTKLTVDGRLAYSTYIGGNGDDNGRAFHLLPSGKVIVGGGNSTSTDMPTDKGTIPGPVLKPKMGGGKDSWIAMVAADGGSLDFCTYFGPSDDIGNGDEEVRALAVDAGGNIWVGGMSPGTDIAATPDAFQPVRGSSRGTAEAYIAKISPDGKRLVYFSWLGGNSTGGIETEGVSDAAGNFYVAGATASTDFPTSPGAFQSELKGGGDGMVAKINNNGSLGFATLYGGSTAGPEAFFGPVVDPAGNVYCTGRFRSTDCPVTSDAFQPQKAGPVDVQDAMLVVFSPDGKRLLYGTYFGGTGTDHGRHIGIHPNGSAVYVIGETNSTDLPLVHAPQSAPSVAFLAKFSSIYLPSPSPEATDTPSSAATETPTLSSTPAPVDFCDPGSGGRGPVTIANIVTGVNIALDALPLSACPALDFDHDGAITIADLLTAVAAVLRAPVAVAPSAAQRLA
jgi:hypothetical protein